jgi:hypothetical protein
MMLRVCRLLCSSVLWLVAPFFVLSTIYGAIRNYSPVPYWDMWDGYIGFYERVSAGDWRAWLIAHNQHRMIFSRLFFWLDLKYFRGLSQLLIPLNLVLMALLWAALVLGMRRLLKEKGYRRRRGFVGDGLLLLDARARGKRASRSGLRGGRLYRPKLELVMRSRSTEPSMRSR